MSKKPIIALILLAAIMALVACGDNLFGTGSSDGDVKAMRIDAENAFRRGDYKGAYKICSKIVATDSTSSFGYYGMAKAAMWERNINIADVIVLLKMDDDENEEGKIQFAKENAYTQNRYLQGLRPVHQALTPLDRRDSLTNLYELHQNALKGIGLDSIFTITKRDTLESGKILTYTIEMNLEERLGDFRRIYCNNAARKCYDTDKRKTPFPLSDREYNGDYFGPILLFATAIKIFMELLDINNDKCITKRGDGPNDTLNHPPADNSKKWVEWGCDVVGHYDVLLDVSKNEDGTFSVDYSNLLDELGLTEDWFKKWSENPNSVTLPTEVTDLNNRLSEFSGNMDDVIKVMEAFGMGDGIAEDGEDWKENVNKYKNQVIFYKSGTHIDEDGDGCIDEELLNGQDGDGDGLKSENARIAMINQYYPGTTIINPLWGKSGINHSMRGHAINNANDTINEPMRMHMSDPRFKPICNNPQCTIVADLIPDEEGFVTVLKFTQEPGYWTTNDVDLKLEVARDTICPPKRNLKWRQDNIGGCWRYYDETKFREYWLKRGLANEEERKRRIHTSCEKY
jgi:hypothetical protein